MSDINEAQSIEFFTHGLAKAAAAADEMARLKQSKEWNAVAMAMRQLRNQGQQLAKMKPLSEVEVLQAVNMREKKLQK